MNNFNYGRFIGEAIESVLNQTFENIELIIVDDGSTDHSFEVIQKYAKKFPGKITTVYKENGGQASAFNSGFELAKGEIICFLDSDDYWFPTKVEKVVEMHKTADIVEHSVSQNNLFCCLLEDKENASYSMKEKGQFKLFVQTSGLSFSKSLLDRVFPIPEKGLEICADTFVVYFALYHSNRVITIKEDLSFYRVHGDNQWAGNEKRDKDNFSSIMKLVNQELLKRDEHPIRFGKERIQYIIDNIEVVAGKKYALYGIGEMGDMVFKKIVESGGEVVLFIDSYSGNTNQKKNGISIISLDHIKDYIDEFHRIIISSTYQEEIFSVLMNNSVSPDNVQKIEL